MRFKLKAKKKSRTPQIDPIKIFRHRFTDSCSKIWAKKMAKIGVVNFVSFEKSRLSAKRLPFNFICLIYFPRSAFLFHCYRGKAENVAGHDCSIHALFLLNPDKMEMEIRELRALENEIYLAKSGTRNDENC